MILIYGYGNPGRQDDGLGVFLAERIEKWAAEENIDDIKVDTNYQLNIEDAYDLKTYQLVVFMDASTEEMKHFRLDNVTPNLKTEFTMHAVSPNFILGLCQQLYGSTPETFLLHIKGYDWEFMEKMSEKAEDNLNRAFDFMKNLLMEKLVKQ